MKITARESTAAILQIPIVEFLFWDSFFVESLVEGSKAWMTKKSPLLIAYLKSSEERDNVGKTSVLFLLIKRLRTKDRIEEDIGG